MNVLNREQILGVPHEDPSRHPDLIVRVTGFSAYFALLSERVPTACGRSNRRRDVISGSAVGQIHVCTRRDQGPLANEKHRWRHFD